MIFALSSVGLEYLITNQRVVGSSPTGQAIQFKCWEVNMWVLFVMVVGYASSESGMPNVAITNAQFPTKEACLNAGNMSIKQSTEKVQIKAWCAK